MGKPLNTKDMLKLKLSEMLEMVRSEHAQARRDDRPAIVKSANEAIRRLKVKLGPHLQQDVR